MRHTLNRREFLGTVAGSMAVSASGSLAARAMASPVAAVLGSQAQQTLEWGSPVFDLHFHLRGQPAANLAHLDGAGIARANLLSRATASEQVRAVQAAAPGRFIWFGSADPSQPAGVDALTQAVKNGARGFGEMKYHVAADGPELRRAYALAADLGVPILVHFQEVDHVANEGTWSKIGRAHV